jgi:SAM-dependent methyltransferase
LAFEAVARDVRFNGPRMLDVGCGTGRSSRFLASLGARVTGLECSPDMLAQARAGDSGIEWVHVPRGERFPFNDGHFDGFFSSWALPEMDDGDDIVALLRECARVTRTGGRGWVIVNTPEFYTHDWRDCDSDFPENRRGLRSGQRVRVRLLPEGIEITDTYWSDEDYRRIFVAAGLGVRQPMYPLAKADGDCEWRDETRVAPYVVYRLSAP